MRWSYRAQEGRSWDRLDWWCDDFSVLMRKVTKHPTSCDTALLLGGLRRPILSALHGVLSEAPSVALVEVIDNQPSPSCLWSIAEATALVDV